METTQGTVWTFDDETRAGEVVLDDGIARAVRRRRVRRQWAAAAALRPARALQVEDGAVTSLTILTLPTNRTRHGEGPDPMGPALRRRCCSRSALLGGLLRGGLLGRSLAAPSWPVPSWRWSSWPLALLRPSWPAFLAVVFLAARVAAPFLAAFFAWSSWPLALLRLLGRLLRGGLLGRPLRCGLLGWGLLGRGLLGCGLLRRSLLGRRLLRGLLGRRLLGRGLLRRRRGRGLLGGGLRSSDGHGRQLLGAGDNGLQLAPARNFGTAVFLARVRSPVRGLRTMRAGRTVLSKAPKPVMATFSPLATSRVIVSSTDSRAC